MSEVTVAFDVTAAPSQGRANSGDARATAFSLLPLSMPLVLDIDGTLIAGDLLHKSLLSILRRNPLIAFSCARWLTGGRAAMKRQVALRSRINWDRVGIHGDVVALALREKAAGRQIVIASAADAVLAGQLASRLGFVDQVFASDGARNLKGSAKARLLREQFPGGFIYAGDSKADLKVWREAKGIVLVRPRASVAAAAQRLGRPTLALAGRVTG